MLRHTVIASALLFAAIAQADNNTLFNVSAQRSILGTDAALDSMLAAPETSDLKLVDVSPLHLEAQEVLNFPIDSKLSLTAVRRNSYRAEDGSVIWEGNISFSGSKKLDLSTKTDEAMQEVTLVQNGKMITGNIRVAGQLFALRPLFDGRHALFAVNDAALPKDHCDDIKVSENPTVSKAEAVSKAISTARVLIMITQAAKNNIADVNAWANLAVSEANQGYSRSGVEVRLELAGTYITSYVETGTFNTDLARFRGKTDGFMDNVHSARDTKLADLVYLVTETGDGCGLASAIGASATTAFAVGTRSCSISNYTFQHELGHLQSARHNPEADGTTTPYAYGHGYRDTQKAWRTVMAYDCSPSCPRLNYWSNPSLILNSRPMGTTTTHHNARVLNNTKATVAAFR